MDTITKQDLDALRTQITKDLEVLINSKNDQNEKDEDFDWMRSKKIRKLMDISPSKFQNFWENKTQKDHGLILL